MIFRLGGLLGRRILFALSFVSFVAAATDYDALLADRVQIAGLSAYAGLCNRDLMSVQRAILNTPAGQPINFVALASNPGGFELFRDRVGGDGDKYCKAALAKLYRAVEDLIAYRAKKSLPRDLVVKPRCSMVIGDLSESMNDRVLVDPGSRDKVKTAVLYNRFASQISRANTNYFRPDSYHSMFAFGGATGESSACNKIQNILPWTGANEARTALPYSLRSVKITGGTALARGLGYGFSHYDGCEQMDLTMIADYQEGCNDRGNVCEMAKEISAYFPKGKLNLNLVYLSKRPMGLNALRQKMRDNPKFFGSEERKGLQNMLCLADIPGARVEVISQGMDLNQVDESVQGLVTTEKVTPQMLTKKPLAGDTAAPGLLAPVHGDNLIAGQIQTALPDGRTKVTKVSGDGHIDEERSGTPSTAAKRALVADAPAEVSVPVGPTPEAIAKMSPTEIVSKLESKMYHHTYAKEKIEDRLNRLDQMVFGEVKSSDSAKDRAVRLASVVDLSGRSSIVSGGFDPKSKSESSGDQATALALGATPGELPHVAGPEKIQRDDSVAPPVRTASKVVTAAPNLRGLLTPQTPQLDKAPAAPAVPEFKPDPAAIAAAATTRQGFMESVKKSGIYVGTIDGDPTQKCSVLVQTNQKSLRPGGLSPGIEVSLIRADLSNIELNAKIPRDRVIQVAFGQEGTYREQATGVTTMKALGVGMRNRTIQPFASKLSAEHYDANGFAVEGVEPSFVFTDEKDHLVPRSVNADGRVVRPVKDGTAIELQRKGFKVAGGARNGQLDWIEMSTANSPFAQHPPKAPGKGLKCSGLQLVMTPASDTRVADPVAAPAPAAHTSR